jgi:hypothetical protein
LLTIPGRAALKCTEPGITDEPPDLRAAFLMVRLLKYFQHDLSNAAEQALEIPMRSGGCQSE